LVFCEGAVSITILAPYWRRRRDRTRLPRLVDTIGSTVELLKAAA
jgi:hypothetical protein